MKGAVKKAVCIILSFLLVFSLASCGDDEKKTACETHAEEFFSAFFARKYRLVHILTNLSDGYIDSIKQIAANEYIDAVMERAFFTIDKDSIKERTSRASCNCSVSIPDYEKAISASDGSLEGFTALLTEQPVEQYTVMKFELRFRMEEGYWVVTTAEKIYQDLYVKMSTVLLEKNIPVISDKNIDTTGNLYFIIPAQLVTLDVFKTAIKLSGDDAYKDYIEADTSKAGADKNLLAYAYSADSATVYQYYSFPSVKDAADYFGDVYLYYNRGTSHEKNKKNNWGFLTAHYDDDSGAYWFWYESTIILVETKNESTSKTAIYRFFAGLGVTG